MSDLPLPEDIERWPSDPFQLLQVTRQVNEKDLKRAYQRLLRVYRPERFPEEFRKLRDAYDEAASWVQHMAAYRDDEQDSSAAADNFGSSGDVDPTATSPGSVFEDRLRDAGECAQLGQSLEAYAQFRRLNEEFPQRVEPYLACYWLLRLDPQLDAGRTPLTWLKSAVKHSSQAEPAWSVYAAELERRPTVALLNDVAEEALACASPFDGLRLFQARWRAAARQDVWRAMKSDLEAIRGSSWWLDRDFWTALMTAALESASFTLNPDAQDIMQWCRTEIDRYPNMHFSMFDALGRLDYLRDLASCVRSLDMVMTDLKPLVRMLSFATSAEGAELYVELVALVDECGQSPSTLLRRLSSLGESSEIVLPRLQEILNRLSWSLGRYDETDWQPQELRHSVGEFLARSPSTYAEARAALLDFCLQRMASPWDVAAAIADDPRLPTELRDEIAMPIRNDLPLNCAYQAFRLFDN
jgi:hypothetical protein